MRGRAKYDGERRERRLNISEPNSPIGRGSTSRVGIDFQSRGGWSYNGWDARSPRSTPPVNSCPSGRGVHPFLYRWTNAPTRNPPAHGAAMLHPFSDSTSRRGRLPAARRRGRPERSGSPARRGDTTLLTRLRCAHLGVTHSFVPSDRRGRTGGREREKER